MADGLLLLAAYCLGKKGFIQNVSQPNPGPRPAWVLGLLSLSQVYANRGLILISFSLERDNRFAESESDKQKRRVRALRFRLSTFDASSSYFQGWKAVLDLQDEFALDTCSPSRCLAL